MLLAQKILWKQRDQDWEPAVALAANFCLALPSSVYSSIRELLALANNLSSLPGQCWVKCFSIQGNSLSTFPDTCTRLHLQHSQLYHTSFKFCQVYQKLTLKCQENSLEWQKGNAHQKLQEVCYGLLWEPKFSHIAQLWGISEAETWQLIIAQSSHLRTGYKHLWNKE